MQFNLERVRKNIREAETEDLLDRVTVYRGEMEPEAVALIETELDQRGVTVEEIRAHEAQRRSAALERPDGGVRKCSFCHRPAVTEGWAWHRLWGRLPVFPRHFWYCEEHRK